jgi:hypothetical protein
MMKKNRVGWVVAFALVAAAVACSSSSSSPGGTGTGTSTGQGTVGASGGKVSTSDGTVTVSIPAGALPGDTQITITEIQSPAPGAIGKTYEIGPTGTQFASPVTLTFKYAGDDLMGNDPSSLEVATIVGTDWVALSADAVDTSAQTASGQTMHLSPYGIHAKGNGNKDGGTTNDATVSGDDGSTGTDGSQSSDDATSDTGIDTGAQDAGFDATGCQLVGQQVGTCANLPAQICSQGTTLMDCVTHPNAGWTGYCCP